MSEQATEPQGPDLAEGVPLAELREGEPFPGHVGDQAVVLVRRGDEVFAIGATCTHYGGPLVEGLVVGETIRCPWHHACFSLRTGEAVGAPALNPVDRWDVEIRDGRVYPREPRSEDALSPHGRRAQGPASVVIIGAGAAGSAAAEMLRREGYAGPITLVDPDPEAPYDRPNLSKDYLAGNAPEEWIPLRPDGFYEAHGITRIVAAAESIDPTARTVTLSDGRTLGFGALLLATGSRPIALPVPGADLPHVHTLRSLEDSRRIIAAAKAAHRAVVIGASFIGMESAASLRTRGLEVTVVAPERVPFEKTLGGELGALLRAAHERNGVRFRLGATAAEIHPAFVRLDDGSELPADLVVVGIGVRPLSALAEAAGLASDGVVPVNEYLETGAPGIYAAGDIARYPEPRSGAPTRVEHWVAAQRQGQAAARSILGRREPFIDPPFFWTRQWEVGISYVGHAQQWQAVEIDGDLAADDATVRFIDGGAVRAVATIGRDRESLQAEAEMESGARRTGRSA
jgi:NADPH-dependent 2,4-dienoyl-CoA reductase/sulfur reductase-like enzyme/nitrite reductase/ring-hydroxylating ferredoxin subunit